ncbi:hypothetical protein [Luteimonas sp. e5]
MKIIEWSDVLQSLPEEYQHRETEEKLPGNAKFILMEDESESTQICLDRHYYANSETLCGIFVPDDLNAKLIYNSNPKDNPLTLVVRGTVSVDAVVVTSCNLNFIGEATCDDLFWGDGDGQLKVLDRVETPILLATRGYDVETYWENLYFDYPLVDSSDHFGDPHLELVKKLFKDDVTMQASGYGASWADFLNRDMIISLYRKGQTALKPAS